MDSSKVKAAALCWLRFGKQLPYVCTEVGHYSADVLGANLESMIEVEVKVSKSDLRADFTKNKHESYLKAEAAHRSLWVPNRFYFAVPEEMCEYAVDFLKDKNPAYGVMSCGDGRVSDALRVVKRAGQLHDRPPKAKSLEAMQMRMGSEIANFHIWDQYHKNTRRDFNELFEKLGRMKDVEAMTEEPEFATPEAAIAAFQAELDSIASRTGKTVDELWTEGECSGNPSEDAKKVHSLKRQIQSCKEIHKL